MQDNPLKKRVNPLYQVQAILSRRDHSEHEVRQKMKRKGFGGSDIDEAVDWAKDNKLINDAVFARRYADSILLSKPVGPRWLQAKLRQKGVAPTLISAVLNDIFAPGREAELATQARDRWQRQHPGQADDPQRLYRFLLSRGFSQAVVSEVTSASAV